jgi:hypothetical protein
MYARMTCDRLMESALLLAYTTYLYSLSEKMVGGRIVGGRRRVGHQLPGALAHHQQVKDVITEIKLNVLEF